MIVFILIILMVITFSYLTYKQRITNKQLHNEITTNSEAVHELESFTYHSENDIKDWIDDGVRDIQYDLDEHSGRIEEIECTTIDRETVDSMISKSHDTLLKIMHDEVLNKVSNITKYLSATTSDFKKTLDDNGTPIYSPDATDEEVNAERAARILQACKTAISDNFPDDNIMDISITFNGEEYSLETKELQEVDNG